CALPQMIAVGNSYQCSYPITVTGNAGDSDTRTVSASGTHADSDPVSDNAMVTVTVDDVLPSGSVALTPSGTVDEGGGNVSVTIEVSNDGSAESLQLTALADDSGSLEGNGDCALPQTIATSGSYSCTATVAIPAQGVGNATVMVTATLADDDGNSINPDQSAMVAVTDAAPTGTVAVTPTPDTVTEAGGTVSFALTFTNTGDESVSLTALDDDGAGNLNGLGSCSVPQTVAGGATYECSYDDAVPTGAPGDETRTITGTFADDDGNTPSAQGMATVTRTDALPTATVTATPDPAILDEPGGATTVTVEVTNTSAADTIDLTSLGDSLAGDLNGLGDCTVPQSIATAASYSCSFTQTISDAAPGPLSTTVTAGFEDDEDNAATANGLASLTIDDLLPTATVGVAVAPDTVSEPGEPVTVTVTVSNTSTADTITVTQLLDSLAGDLNGQGDCATPFDLAPAAIAECSFTAEDDAQAGTLERTVSTLFADEEDNPGTAEGMATVTVTDVAPAISVTLAATPETVAATGGTVSFIATVTNTGTGDALTLTALTDDTLGDLDGSGDCALPQTIPIAGAYSCTYTDTLAGDAGTDGTRTVDATASDEEMTVAPGDGSVTIAFSNEAPLFSLDRSVTSPPVAEPGGTVTFSIVIASEESTRTLTIDSLTDSRDGNLDGTGTCAVPQVLAAGETYRCDYTIEVTGASASVPRTSTTEASATTDDLFSGTAADSASVIFLDVTPMATASYTATPAEATPPSAAVRFDIEIANTGDAEPLELTSLQDDAVGDVSLLGNCQLPATIPPGDSFTCAFTAVVAGEPNEAVARNLTASVADDDGNGVLADDWTMIVFGEAPQMNTAPTAAADSYAATEDTTLVIVAPGLLDNDSDAEDDVLTVFDNTTPAAGTLSVAADGSLTYEPAPDATATVTFSYRATDGAALSESATVTVTIAAVNDPPVAAYDSFSFAGEGSLEVAAPGVLTNDEDVDSALTVRIGTPPASGTVELDADGGFRYTAGAGFAGADTFTYFATDGEFEAEAIVTIAAGERVFKDGFEEPELPNQP
ncbi:MAG: cadherin-like domain-containing protein, partial [Pseudomonadota bacterium]